jgi:predicted amidohydrolase
MRIAALQFKPVKGDPAASLAALAKLIVAAGEQGAQLIVCPEMALTGYLFPDAATVAPLAEPADGGSFAELATLAARYSAYLVCGYPELGAATGVGRPPLYNSARVIGPQGQLLYNYRKRLLYDSDWTWANPGDTPYPLLPLVAPAAEPVAGPPPICSVGICMDLNDDRFTAFLRQQAPSVVAFCTNWLDEGVDVLGYWRYRLLGCRSVLVAANSYGSELCSGHPPTRFCGRSTILAADGRVLARARRSGDAVLIADLPPGV